MLQLAAAAAAWERVVGRTDGFKAMEADKFLPTAPAASLVKECVRRILGKPF